MSNAEYIIGVSRERVDDFARAQGWQSRGRADWRKPDGTTVRYLHFPEQAAGVAIGATVHAVGFNPELEVALVTRQIIIARHFSDEELEQARRFIEASDDIMAINDDLRAAVERKWPELAKRLPRRPPH